MPSVVIPSVVIVGAGVSGLSAAFRIQGRLPHANITVLEANSRPGGAAWTLRENGFQVEAGPNGFLDNKPTTLQFSDDLGLAGERLQASTASARNRFLFLEDRLRKLPSGPLSFLASNLFSWRSKWALVTERFRKTPPPLGDESIDAFARRRTTDEIADILADAMVSGIFAGDPKRLSMAACFPRLVEWERAAGSVMGGMAAAAKERKRKAQALPEPERSAALKRRRTSLWSFQGGLRTMVEQAARSLKQAPLFGVNVRAIERSATGDGPLWRVRGDGNDHWNADALVLACPGYAQADMMESLDPALAERVRQIPYNRVVVAALGFRKEDVTHPMDGFGYIAPQKDRRDLLGVQWCSSIYPGRAPAGAVLLRAICGGWNRPEVVDWEEARLVSAVRDELRLAMGVKGEPIFHSIVRWPRAIPQYELGHLERVREIHQLASKHEGLFLGGNLYHGVSLNDCTEQGLRIADDLTAWLKAQGQTQA